VKAGTEASGGADDDIPGQALLAEMLLKRGHHGGSASDCTARNVFRLLLSADDDVMTKGLHG
jgi:hypothetical protein